MFLLPIFFFPLSLSKHVVSSNKKTLHAAAVKPNLEGSFILALQETPRYQGLGKTSLQIAVLGMEMIPIPRGKGTVHPTNDGICSIAGYFWYLEKNSVAKRLEQKNVEDLRILSDVAPFSCHSSPNLLFWMYPKP